LVRVVQEVVQVGRSREVTEIKLCFNSCGNVRALTVNAQHLSTRAFPGESTALEIYTLCMAPRKFCLPQAPTLCALELHAATFTLRHPPRRFYLPQALELCDVEIQALPIAILKFSSCVLSSSRPSHCYLRSRRQFYHPQATTLCALELHVATFTLRVFHPASPSPSCTLLRDFTTLKPPSCAPLSARPSSLLPSTSSAILQPWKFSSCMPSSSKL
jgi:hypothetical protein